jgi:hypothetical protein
MNVMNILILAGISVILVSLVMAGLGIRLLAGKDNALKAGSCGSAGTDRDRNFSCGCGKSGCCQSV